MPYGPQRSACLPDLDGRDPVAVGDIVRLGLSNPCTAFDKWRLVPLVEKGRVVEAVGTFF